MAKNIWPSEPQIFNICPITEKKYQCFRVLRSKAIYSHYLAYKRSQQMSVEYMSKKKELYSIVSRGKGKKKIRKTEKTFLQSI